MNVVHTGFLLLAFGPEPLGRFPSLPTRQKHTMCWVCSTLQLFHVQQGAMHSEMRNAELTEELRFLGSAWLAELSSRSGSSWTSDGTEGPPRGGFPQVCPLTDTPAGDRVPPCTDLAFEGQDSWVSSHPSLTHCVNLGKLLHLFASMASSVKMGTAILTDVFAPLIVHFLGKS